MVSLKHLTPEEKLEHRRLQQKDYNIANAERNNARNKAWRSEHVDEIKADRKAYYVENRHKIITYVKNWYNDKKRARESLG